MTARTRSTTLLASLFLAALIALSLCGEVALADDAVTANVAVTTNQTTSADSAQQGSDENANSFSVELDNEQNAIKESQVPDSSFIYDTPLSDLASADIYYDDTTVQVVGEAVGDIINEEDVGSGYRWVSLWDNNNTIVVYMSANDASLIDSLGSNHRKGTKLQVRGTFHLTCDEHNGISDLHAENVTVLEKGRATQEAFNPLDFVPGVIAVAIGIGLLFLFRHLRDRDV